MLEVANIYLRVSQFSLKGIDIRVAKGEYFVLFGPTGSGKTLLLETIAGLRCPDAGAVVLNDRDITHADPAERRIGYVPQDLALIPFKTVWQNMAFGLFSRMFRPPGGSRERSLEIKRRVGEMLAMLKLEHLADRRPERLSGGEKQRVALGRALVMRPDLLLLDEPLSNVDENTGDALMREIKKLQRQFGIATLHICHRHAEMAYLADRVAVMRDGAILRIATPTELTKKSPIA